MDYKDMELLNDKVDEINDFCDDLDEDLDWKPREVEGEELIKPLVQQLRATLINNPQNKTETAHTMQNQAQALDQVFRRMLIDADTIYKNDADCHMNSEKYVLALKAQNLFCRTAKAMSQLKIENLENELAALKNAKGVKRTEGFVDQ